jgi:divalent metal cation (Fe/Co/Zn/Cd) transporter
VGTVKYALLPVKVVGFAVGVLVLGLGVPLLWVFIASKLSDTFLSLPLLSLFVMVMGLGITYMLLAAVVARYDKERAQLGPARMSWNRSLGAERNPETKTTQWERVFITTCIVMAFLFEIWFFVFAGSSLPGNG